MKEFSHSAVWRIAAPMILSNISIPLLGMVDTGVAGHLPNPAYLGAVAVGATIFNFIFMGLNFLRMGTTGITAQFFGAGNTSAIRSSLGQSISLALTAALILIAIQWPLRETALLLIKPSSEVAGLARVYFDIRIWSAPAVLTNYALIGWFLGMQNARVPLIHMLT
ncbi:MAG: MATE family efflux transporter, partial [Gammaproteobacteria bacterium]|nr:MATE family efflux transporter [Gammaproteobacteria bacterium]